MIKISTSLRSVLFPKLFIYLFFLLILAIGVNQVRNYGITFDEPVSRENGGISLRYVIEKFEIKLFNNDRQLENLNVPLKEYRDRDYGVVFDLPAFALERALKLDDTRSQYLLRHTLTYFLYWIGLISFFILLTRSLGSYIYGFIGVLMLFLSPRIFADSFYNNKDLVLMSLGMMCSLSMFNFLKETTLRNCLIHALLTALTVDTRIVGLVFAVTTVILFCYFKFGNRRFQYIARFTATYLFFLCLFVYIFWPWLWDSPLQNIITAFRNMANFRWPNYNFYFGNYISAQQLPWHYSIVWIGITTPAVYLLLAACGYFFTIKQILIKHTAGSINYPPVANCAATLITAGTLIPIIILNSTLYDGWRQLYFIYPSIIYLSAFGLQQLLRHFQNKPALRSANWVRCIVLAQLLFVALWMYRHKPFQNVYFNFLAPSNWSEYFEGDYWGVTNLRLLEFIAANDTRYGIKIAGVGATSIIQSLSMLPFEAGAPKFVYVDELYDADYFISNFRFFSADKKAILKELPDPYFELLIDNNRIAAIYKR